MSARKIGVVTVARSDYGICLPVLRRIQKDPELELCLLVTGAHLSPAFGQTVQIIESDEFEIAERIEMLLSSDMPQGIAKSMGVGIIGFAAALDRLRPDILVVLGDRFEMIAAALAALPFKIPVAHLHGGEITEGAIDEAVRHAITKVSHLHFVSTAPYAARVIQMGEEPWRVTISGAPSLDNLSDMTLWSFDELNTRYQLHLEQAPILVTFHPVTLEYEQTAYHITEFLAALDQICLPQVFTAPNADTSHNTIRRAIQAYLETHPMASFVENFGTQGYFSMMAVSAAMVGNSSSGVLEAATFHLPVINIGTRQQGRVRGANVIDVGYARDEIVEAMKRALSPEFRASLADLVDPYRQERPAADIIVERLKTVPLDDRLIVKKFYDGHTNS